MEQADFDSTTHLDRVQRHRPHGRLLDVGCNTGYMLATAEERGFRATGVEIDLDAVRYGRSLGRHIRQGTLQEAEFPSGSYDVITANHVLEHVVEADDLLREITRILAPDGIVYITVPNYMSLKALSQGDSWEGYHPTQHVWHFTAATLDELVTRTTPLKRKSLEYGHTHSTVSRSPSRSLLRRFAEVMRVGETVHAVYSKA